jgi:hypothetical protein
MSGIETRAGSRKRSNSSLKRIGSKPVIKSDQATIEPTAEPRPGPTGMPLEAANFMKSETISR